MEGNLKIPEHIYLNRVRRLSRLIELGAPTIIQYREVQLILKSFEGLSWQERFKKRLRSMRIFKFS
jgi:hypothetical protein